MALLFQVWVNKRADGDEFQLGYSACPRLLSKISCTLEWIWLRSYSSFHLGGVHDLAHKDRDLPLHIPDDENDGPVNHQHASGGVG